VITLDSASPTTVGTTHVLDVSGAAPSADATLIYSTAPLRRPSRAARCWSRPHVAAAGLHHRRRRRRVHPAASRPTPRWPACPAVAGGAGRRGWKLSNGSRARSARSGSRSARGSAPGRAAPCREIHLM
jgi:hypothetical protein